MSCSSLQNAQCSLPILFSLLPVQAPVRMSRTPHASLAQIFHEVDQGVDLHVAFTAHPGLTWGQVQRAAKSRQAVLGAASALAGVNARRERCTLSTAAMSVEEHQGAAAATRTPSGSARAGTPVAQPTRQTQHQVEVTLSNEHLFRDQISSGCTRARPRPMRSRRGTASYGHLASSPSRSPQLAPEIRESRTVNVERHGCEHNAYKTNSTALSTFSRCR